MRNITILFTLFVYLFSIQLSAQIPAFPGAEGFGATTTHGRGGKIIKVTNLNSTGPGSLRAACVTSGARIIVFEVSGIIDLGSSPITINNPYCYIAGQTAPGDGICIKNAPFIIGAHDVVVRFIRSRPGDSTNGATPDGRDAVSCYGGGIYNIVVDHCSMSWSIDGNFDIGHLDPNNRVHDVTAQYCLFAEALNNSLHPKGGHSYCNLIADYSQNISMHHNLYAHNNQRHPMLKGDTKADVRNNVMYNWGSGATQINDYEKYSVNPNYANVVGNFYKKGFNSNKWEVQIDTTKLHGIRHNSQIYLQGNIGPNKPTLLGDEWSICNNQFKDIRASQPFDVPSISQFHPDTLYMQLVTNAGALYPQRDAVDIRIMNDVINSTGKIINSPSETPGYPTYNSVTPQIDSDNDGMPNDWETAHNLDSNNYNDCSLDRDTDGYTNIEEYLNSLVLVAPSMLKVNPYASEGNITLKWLDYIADETAFVIERADNSSNGFVTIATLNANTTSFSDASANISQNYSYRVKAMRGSFSSSYTNIVKVNGGANEISSIKTAEIKMECTPNPFKEECKIQFSEMIYEPLEISIWDLSGRCLQHFNASLEKSDFSIMLNRNQLKNGIYLLKSVTPNAIFAKKITII